MTPLPIQRQMTATPPPPPPPLLPLPLPAISSPAPYASSGGQSSIDTAALQCTPQHRSRLQMPQSAPPPNSRRSQALLTSPAAIRRSNETLEAIRVAQTLKAGFSRLKARADSQTSPSSAPLSQRAFSATSPPPVTPARRQFLSRHHSSIAFSRGSPTGADSTLRRSEAAPMSRELLRESVVSPSLRPMHPSYSCPQRRQSLRGPHNQPSLLFPAPRFSLERAQSAASSSSAVTHSPPPSLGGSKRANKEVAEAAETMILFMRDSPTQGEERRATMRPSDGPSSPSIGSPLQPPPPRVMLSASERNSLEICDPPRLKDDESESEYAPLPSTSSASTASLPRSQVKRPRTDHSPSSPSNAGPSLSSKRVNIGH